MVKEKTYPILLAASIGMARDATRETRTRPKAYGKVIPVIKVDIKAKPKARGKKVVSKVHAVTNALLIPNELQGLLVYLMSYCMAIRHVVSGEDQPDMRLNGRGTRCPPFRLTGKGDVNGTYTTRRAGCRGYSTRNRWGIEAGPMGLKKIAVGERYHRREKRLAELLRSNVANNAGHKNLIMIDTKYGIRGKTTHHPMFPVGSNEKVDFKRFAMYAAALKGREDYLNAHPIDMEAPAASAAGCFADRETLEQARKIAKREVIPALRRERQRISEDLLDGATGKEANDMIVRSKACLENERTLEDQLGSDESDDETDDTEWQKEYNRIVEESRPRSWRWLERLSARLEASIHALGQTSLVSGLSLGKTETARITRELYAIMEAEEEDPEETSRLKRELNGKKEAEVEGSESD